MFFTIISSFLLKIKKTLLEKDISKYPPHIIEDQSYNGKICQFLLKYTDSINTFFILYLFVSYIYICSLLNHLNEENKLVIIILSISNTLISLIFTMELFFNIIYLGNFVVNPYYYGYFYVFLDVIAGPIAIFTDLGYFLETGRIGYYSNAMRLLKLFSLHKIRILASEILYILPKCSNILFSIFFVFYIFSFVGKELFSKVSPQYFGNMSKSMLTMFQVLTQDDWRYEINDPIMKKEGYFVSFFFILFMIIMFYTFLNIFLGIFVSYYSNSKIKKNMDYDYKNDDYLNNELILKKKNSVTYEELLKELSIFQKKLFIDKVIRIFDKIIYSYWIVTIINNYFSYYLAEKNKLGYLLFYISELIYGTIFTIHLIILCTISEKSQFNFIGRINFTYPVYLLSTSCMIDLISGPIAILFDIYQLSLNGIMQIGPILRVLKLLNTVDNKQIINRLYEIMPRILPVFCFILAIIYYSAFYATFNLKYSENAVLFTNFRTSFLTLFQIMTLDSWGEIARRAYKEKPYTAFFFVGFIILTSFFLVSILMGMIANSSTDITEKIFESSLKSKEMIPKEDYPEILADLKEILQKADDSKNNKFFFESLSKEDQNDYLAAKELIDEFNSNKIDESFLNEKSRFSSESYLSHLKEESKSEDNFNENEGNDFLTIIYEGKKYEIHTKNLLLMRE